MKYSIKDAAHRINVESHVLRYWEEELSLDIPRNELGHRYYGEEQMKQLQGIQMLKEKNFSLRAIKVLLPEVDMVCQLDDFGMEILKEELEKRFIEEDKAKIVVLPQVNHTSAKTREPVIAKPIRVTEDGQETSGYASNMDKNGEEAVQMISKQQHAELTYEVTEAFKNLFLEILDENNRKLEQGLKQSVMESVVKEVDYMLRTQEEREEEYFRNLDELIRGTLQTRKQIAATKAERRKGIFHRRVNKQEV